MSPAPASIVFILHHVPDAFRGRGRLRTWLHRVARAEGQRIHHLTFVLMGERELLKHNQHWLGHDEHTDVITFPYGNDAGLHGEVLISLDRVRENARQLGVSAASELRRVMVHALLHLCGHDDRTTRQRKAMRGLEDRYMALFA